MQEDEQQVAHLTNLLKQIPLGDEALTCEIFTSTERLQKSLRHDTYNLVILDWSVESIDTITLLQWLRSFQKNAVPLVIVSARGSEQDVAKAFKAGAYDYAIKPIRPIEFSARVLRLLRKHTTAVSSAITAFGNWTFDRANSVVKILHSGTTRAVILTDREFRLALALFEHLGSPLSRSHLLEYSGVSGDEAQSRALDSHIYRLRGKLFLNDAHGIRLKTVYGHGYRLDMAAQG